MKKSAVFGHVLRSVCARGSLLAVCVAMTADAWAATLPEGYAQVEYVESTADGGQYINTGYTPTLNTRIVAEFDSMTRSQDWAVFFGVTGNDSSSDGVLLRYYGNGNDINGWFANAAYEQAQIANLAGRRLAAELKSGSLTINGATCSITTTGTPYGGPVYVFCGNNGGAAWRHQAMRLYSFKI